MFRAEQWAKQQEDDHVSKYRHGSDCSFERFWVRSIAGIKITQPAQLAVSLAAPRKIPCGNGRDLKLEASPE